MGGGFTAITWVTFPKSWLISCSHSGSSKHTLSSRADNVFWSSRHAWACIKENVVSRNPSMSTQGLGAHTSLEAAACARPYNHQFL